MFAMDDTFAHINEEDGEKITSYYENLDMYVLENLLMSYYGDELTERAKNLISGEEVSKINYYYTHLAPEVVEVLLTNFYAPRVFYEEKSLSNLMVFRELTETEERIAKAISYIQKHLPYKDVIEDTIHELRKYGTIVLTMHGYVNHLNDELPPDIEYSITVLLESITGCTLPKLRKKLHWKVQDILKKKDEGLLTDKVDIPELEAILK
jgi:hypothetical protein